MKSVWTPDTFIPSSGVVVEHLGHAEAVRDVARRVLVVEGVEERRVRLADARRAVDERELAEVAGTVVDLELPAHDARALVGLHVDDLPVLHRQLEPFDDVAVEHQRTTRADRSLRAAAVGCREHFFRRHVRDVLDPVARPEQRRHPPRVGVEADGQVGARPGVVDRVEAEVVQPLRASFQPLHVVPPRLDRVSLVEPRAEGDGFPQTLDVGLAVDLLRPAFARVRDAGPVERPLHHLAADDLRDLFHTRPADALAVEVVHQLGLGVAGRPELRLAFHGVVEHLQPLR